MTAVYVVLAAGAFLGGWYADARYWHQWKTCPRCRGGRRIRGFVRGTHADCRRCGNEGRVRRLGAGKAAE